jgi:hypothetical protein
MAGVTIQTISIDRDARTGLMVRVRAVGDARQLRVALDQYAFRVELLAAPEFST